MMNFLRTGFCAPLLCALLSAPQPAAAEAPQRIDVEAVVAGPEGQRARGLTAQDFKLLVDGREVPIGSFSEVEGQGTSYLVFVDDSFSMGVHRNAVLARLAKELGRLGPGDRMAVVAFDGHRIERLTDWTGDRATLARVFEKARQRPAWGIHRMALQQSATWGGPQSVLSQVEGAIGATAAAMRALDVPPGRRAFLLLSGGWPMLSAGEPLRKGPAPSPSPEGEKLFQPLVDTANLLGYTIYPVDMPVRGLSKNPSDVSAHRPAQVTYGPSNQNQERLGISTIQQGGPPQLPPPGFMMTPWERASQDALSFLARETGGRAVPSLERLEAHERTVNRSYYSLAFAPQWESDGELHKIRVEVRPPGFSVRSRNSHVDLAPPALVAESLRRFEEGSGTKRLPALAGKPVRAGSSREVPVLIEIPAGTLAVAPGSSEARVLLSIAVLESPGSREESQISELRFPVQGGAQGEPLHYKTTVRVRKGAQRLLLAVSDPLGGGQLWTELEVAP